MENESLKNPIILAVAVRPALATWFIFNDGQLDGYAESLMGFAFVLADSLLFTWLVREVIQMKRSTNPEEADVEKDA